MLAVELARYLAYQGLVTFDEAGAAGDVFIGRVTSKPDEAVFLFPTGGFGSDPKLGYDLPTVQVRVRGRKDDPVGPYERARALYDVLHGLHDVELPGGTWLVLCQAVQSDPASLGQDGNGRYEYTQNYLLDVRAPTRHRE